jgi:hypothetical protein
MAGALAQRVPLLARPWYAIGALSAGIMTDLFGAATAIAAIGALTFASGAVVAVAVDERRQSGNRVLSNMGSVPRR